MSDRVVSDHFNVGSLSTSDRFYVGSLSCWIVLTSDRLSCRIDF